jgi:hypothetical protein
MCLTHWEQYIAGAIAAEPQFGLPGMLHQSGSLSDQVLDYRPDPAPLGPLPKWHPLHLNGHLTNVESSAPA